MFEIQVLEKSTQCEEPGGVIIWGAATNGSNDLLETRPVRALDRIEVSCDHELVMRRDIADSILKEVIKAIFIGV